MNEQLLAFLETLSRFLQDNRLMPILVLMVAAVLLMTSMRRRRPAQTPPPVVPRKKESGASTHLLHRDLDELLVELQELSRRITAEIDTRFAKLEAAMRDADRRIAVLSRLTRQSHEAGGKLNSGDESAVDRGDPRHTVIHELADAGFTAVEIGRELGRTPGEVELILNLRRHTHAQAADPKVGN